MAEPSRGSLPFAATAEEGYSKNLVGFLNEAVQQGDAFVRAQKGFENIQKTIDAINSVESNPRATALSSTQANHVGKTALDLSSLLTDTKPFWEYRTPPGSSFEKTGDNLGKLSEGWYLKRRIDVRQCDVIKYSLAGGTGYAHLTWNPRLLDLDMSGEDPRDVLPISPVDYDTLQTGLGAIVRRQRTLWYVKDMYGIEVAPDRDGTTTTGGGESRAQRLLEKLGGSPFWDVLTKSKPARTLPRLPTVDVFTVYLHDDRANEKPYPVQIGEFDNSGKPLNNWSYIVEPGEQLYPRGRMIEYCKTWKRPLYDGPNKYWHGMFPLPKLTLDPWPWTFLGKGALWDTLPLQGTLNRLLRLIDDKIEKWGRPDVVADKNSMSQGALDKIDTRRAGLKIRFNPMSGKGVEIRESGPLDPSIMPLIQFIIQEIQELSGSADMRQLMKLNQLPSDDSISRLIESMSMAVQARSRALEAYIREFATIVAFNFFQFYTEPMWLETLGPYAVTPDWFDFDPGTFLPDFIHRGDFGRNGQPTQEALDRGPMPRMDRSKEMMRNLAFHVAPGSLLAASEIEQKLLYLQLSRAGLIDHWTLLEKLRVPNVGDAPAGNITERLKAEQAMGLNMNNSSVGRKASGQTMPRMTTKES